MATPAEHRAKALHNEQFIHSYSLGAGDFADWAVTALFYSAVHWLRALITKSGFHVGNYKEEEFAATVLLRKGMLNHQAWQWYRNLKDDSRDARYEMVMFTPADYEHLHRECFIPLRAFVQDLLSP